MNNYILWNNGLQEWISWINGLQVLISWVGDLQNVDIMDIFGTNGLV